MFNIPKQKTIMFFPIFIFFLTFQSYIMTISRSKSTVDSLSGYPGRLPFKLETGYVGIGEEEDIQLFYYFVESEGNPKKDPIILHLTGGPGCSAFVSFFYQIGPLRFNFDNAPENLTITLNPHSWTKMASVIFVDMPAGTGFSYAKTEKAWISSDSIVVTQVKDFLKKFLTSHSKFLKNPLYISGISYMGIIAPIVTLDIYDGNERGDQPTLNIQGYILCSPLTDKFRDFNSRFEYSHRMALISDDIYKSAIKHCYGNYVNVDPHNRLCVKSLEQYGLCINRINMENILDPLCPSCEAFYVGVVEAWVNDEVVQQALHIRQGMIGKWKITNTTIHYAEGKTDTSCYAYDIFSSFSYHKKLVSKNCRALIFSGDHDMTFPYVGIEQWIASLNIGVESTWKPFYVDDQVGGYEMTYAQNDFSLKFATIKGAGHSVPRYKPREAMILTQRWLASPTYSSDS